MADEITQADRELLKSCMDNPPARIYSELVPAVVALRAIAAARRQPTEELSRLAERMQTAIHVDGTRYRHVNGMVIASWADQITSLISPAAPVEGKAPSGGEVAKSCAHEEWDDTDVGYVCSECGEFLKAYENETAAPPSAPEPQVVPGVMACAKCKFQVVRTNLYLRNGTTGPGGNETEPCPNGCGPLWPVTWEQEARECWARFEELAEDVADARRFHWIEANAKVHAFSHGWVHWPQNPDRRPLAERIDEVIAKAATDESRG